MSTLSIVIIVYTIFSLLFMFLIGRLFRNNRVLWKIVELKENAINVQEDSISKLSRALEEYRELIMQYETLRNAQSGQLVVYSDAILELYYQLKPLCEQNNIDMDEIVTEEFIEKVKEIKNKNINVSDDNVSNTFDKYKGVVNSEKKRVIKKVEYNMDEILDKISSSGMDSLSQGEMDFLKKTENKK